MSVKRRRLSDLYVRGVPATVDDGAVGENGEPLGPVQVWVQKLNPVEQETALRRAAAERAKHLITARDRESDVWKAAWSDLQEYGMDRERMLLLVLGEELTKTRLRIEAELSAEDEWKEDGYLQGLFDAWEGSGVPDEDGAEPLKIVYLRGDSDPQYEEAKRVFDEIERWGAKVRDLLEDERERLFREHDNVDDDRLRDMAVERSLEQHATSVMLREFETQELLFAVRDPANHSKRYFENRDEVVGLQQKVREALSNAYRILLVDPIEGKESPGTPGSLPSSESPVPEETPSSSGLVAANA